MDYKRALKIDKDALDEALMRQPQLFDDVAQEHAEAISERDALKEAVDVAKARAELSVRLKLEKLGEKVTEPLVKTRTELHPDYRQAVKDYLQAKKASDILQAHKEAFQQRSYVLKDLAALYVAGYFSVNSVKGANANRSEERRVGKECRSRW